MSRPAVFASQGYEEVLATAKESGRLLVLDATASWCQPCQTMDRVTWVDVKVVAWIAEHAIAVQIDVDKEKELAAALAIRAMPTIIVFRSGTEFDRVVGLKRPAELIEWLEAVRHGETVLDQLRRTGEPGAIDVRARLTLARALASSQRFAEATEEYVWLWQHTLDHEPTMVGVRASYMLNEIATLIQEHLPARARFAEIRDALGADGVATTASSENISDWIALSQTLGEDDRVLKWLDRNGTELDARPDLEGILRIRLVGLLVSRGRWADVSRFFRDPLAALRQSLALVERITGQRLPPEMEAMRPKMIASCEDKLHADAGVIVASLLAAGRESEARVVVDEIRRLRPGEKTERVLAETARKAGVPPP